MANIELRLSTGGAGTTNSTPANSIGGNMATNPEAIINTSNTTLNNLWNNVSKTDNFNGVTTYRCVYIHNDTATSGDIFANGTAYMTGSPLATFTLGLVATKNTAAGTIADEHTAPSGITFTAPTSGSPLALLSSSNVLNPGDYIGLWLKRVDNNITGSGSVTDTQNISINGTQ
jgi:hypothetical protein